MNVSINNIPDGNFAAPQNIQEIKERHKTEHEELITPQELEEPPIKTEILTKTDIEIRKLHALRRAREFIAEQLINDSRNAEKTVSGNVSDFSSSAGKEFDAWAKDPLNTRDIVKAGDDMEVNPADAAFKTGEAISGYKTYKKETPKAWESGDIDEKR